MTTLLTLTLSDAVMWTSLFTVAVTVIKCILVDPINKNLVKLGLAIDSLNEESKNRMERLIKVEEREKQNQSQIKEQQSKIDSIEKRCFAVNGGLIFGKGVE